MPSNPTVALGDTLGLWRDKINLTIAEVNSLVGSSGYADATTTASGLMSAADKTKLNGVANNANNYTHPATHPASIIVESTTKRFVTDAEKVGWNAAKNHADSAHAPSNAQKNSDITKEEIEARLTGILTSHCHAALAAARTISLSGDCSGSTSFDGSANVDIPVVVANDSHAHSNYSTTSHVHSNYLTADMGHNAVGSFCFATKKGNDYTTVYTDGTIPGSELTPTGIQGGSLYYGRTTVQGTWRCLGFATGPHCVTLWQRIA